MVVWAMPYPGAACTVQCAVEEIDEPWLPLMLVRVVCDARRERLEI